MPNNLKDLVKNPLGIIALFIALIYGFAALLLGFSASQLSQEERLPLIWFIVLFPVVVLGCFYVLVTRHHGKLYAPKDYQNDNSFLSTLPAQRQLDRLDEEIIDSEHIENLLSATTEVEVDVKNADDQALFSVSASTKKSKSDDPSSVNTNIKQSLRNKYQQAEMLALSKIEIDEGYTFRHQVSFGENTGIEFDGVSIAGDNVTVAEVKYIRAKALSIQHLQLRGFINEILARAVLASNYIENSKRFSLILIFVLEDDSGGREMSFIDEVDKRSKIVPFSVKSRFYLMDDLKT